MSDEWGKADEHLRLDKAINFDNDIDYRLASAWPFLVERYTNGRFKIHFHFSIRSVSQHGSNLSDYCAVFQSAYGQCEALDLSMTKSLDGKVSTRNRCMDNVDQAVFVVVRDFLEKPKGMQVWRPVRSVVRLQALNACLCPNGEPFNFCEAAAAARMPFPINLRVAHWVQKDGELITTGRIPAMRQNESPDQVVKGRSEVVDTVSDQGSPFEGQLLIEPHSNQAIIGTRIEIEDGTVGVSIKEVLDLPLESIEMHLCSFELEEDGYGRAPWFHHEVYSIMVEKRTQKTPKGHKIPVPTRNQFLRDLEKVAKPKTSPTRRPKK